MRILITAGPTREPIDPVRYLSNFSTGRMGCALAEEALARGHTPRLVLGPAEEQPPVGVEVYAVETAEEMLAAVLELLPEADAVICAAAVCDFRPARLRRSKIRRGGLASLELVATPDIAAAVGARKGSRPLAVFALESDGGAERAREKLARKDADLCVLNGPEAIGAEEAVFTILRRDGTARELGRTGKRALAAALLDELGA